MNSKDQHFLCKIKSHYMGKRGMEKYSMKITSAVFDNSFHTLEII